MAIENMTSYEGQSEGGGKPVAVANMAVASTREVLLELRERAVAETGYRTAAEEMAGACTYLLENLPSSMLDWRPVDGVASPASPSQ